MYGTVFLGHLTTFEPVERIMSLKTAGIVVGQVRRRETTRAQKPGSP